MFKEACTRGCKKEVPQEMVILRLALKRLQIARHVAYSNDHCSVTIF